MGLQLRIGCASGAISEAEKVADSLGEVKVSAEQGRRKGPNGCGSRIGSGEQKGSKEQRGATEDKEERVTSLSLHQIIDSHRTYICTACTSAALTHPLHYAVALDSGSEARYVCRQGRGLGI